ncbi:MAG: hypothetical protein JWM64_2166, partial [Frankiales bacterium]|nr:hypothetical protein [Frankiales bacterium]
MLAAPPRRAAERSALLAAGAVGAGVALQSRVNGELQVALDDTLLAACVSFVGGLLLVTGVVLSRPCSRKALARVRQVRGWERLGGLGGAGLIAVGAAAAPRLGVALLTLGLVAGQTVGGLAVDGSLLGRDDRVLALLRHHRLEGLHVGAGERHHGGAAHGGQLGEDGLQ